MSDRKTPECFVIIGAGRMGAETLQVANQMGVIEIVGFLDDLIESGSVGGCPILGGEKVAKKLLDREPDLKAVVAIGNPITRKSVVKRYQKIGFSFGNLIHPSAVVPESVSTGSGCVVLAGCVFTVDIQIKNHVIFNPCISVAHDAVIGSYVMINSQVAINGNVIIEDGVYVGTGAILTENIKVGAWSFIGAGAVVTNDVPPESLVVGIPAKVIKRNPLLPE